MQYAELYRFGQRRLRELGLTPPLDLDALRRVLEEERGTTITVIASDEIPPGSAFGVTGRRGDQEVVLHESRTSGSHRSLIVLHEFAHMLLRHPPSSTFHGQAGGFYEISAAAVAETLGVIPSPTQREADPSSGAAPRRWLQTWRRSVPATAESPTLYDDDREQEAETLATVLLGWVPGQNSHISRRPAPGLSEMLEDRGAW